MMVGLQVRKSIQLCKGVRLNVGSKGVSVSLGTKGLRHTIHTSGRRTTTLGIPGTGISYTKRHQSFKKQKSLQQAPKMGKDHINNVKARNAVRVAEYENMINSLRGVHQCCDDYVDWQSIRNSDEPFQRGTVGPKQTEALEACNKYCSGPFRWLKSRKKKEKLQRAVEQAAKEDAEDYENWERLKLLSERVMSGDTDAYLEVIREMNPMDDLLDFGSEFELGTDDPAFMNVEFNVKSDMVIPKFSLHLTKTGKLSKKDLSKTAYYGLMQDYVCSCALRIARDVFALLPVKAVLVHAVEDRVDTQTGNIEDVTILSVLFNRNIVDGLIFDRIDASDAMNNFPHEMRFLKTSGFKPVERMEVPS